MPAVVLTDAGGGLLGEPDTVGDFLGGVQCEG
jgi:hypothetical protein